MRRRATSATARLDRSHLDGFLGRGIVHRIFDDIVARIVPDELARYLVETGQAVVALIRVEDPLASPADEAETQGLPSETGEETGKPDDNAADEDWPWEPAYLESLTTKKLRDLADRYGISMPSETVKKADLIELLLHSALPDDETE